MKKYLIVQKGYFKILEFKFSSDATNWAINHLDLSNEPYIFEVLSEDINTFSLDGFNLFSLNAKKFFKYIGSGEKTMIFKKELLNKSII